MNTQQICFPLLWMLASYIRGKHDENSSNFHHHIQTSCLHHPPQQTSRRSANAIYFLCLWPLNWEEKPWINAKGLLLSLYIHLWGCTCFWMSRCSMLRMNPCSLGYIVSDCMIVLISSVGIGVTSISCCITTANTSWVNNAFSWKHIVVAAMRHSLCVWCYMV